MTNCNDDNIQIYHATCHADAVQSGTLVEADTDMQDVHSNLKRKLNDAEENVSVGNIYRKGSCLNSFLSSYPNNLVLSNRRKPKKLSQTSSILYI